LHNKKSLMGCNLIDNSGLFRALLLGQRIRINQAPFFDQDPPPLPQNFRFDRVEGMLLGLAIGDSLGNTSESRLPEGRKTEHGEIRDYLPNKYADDQPVGVPSDDTQLSYWTLEQLIEDNGLVPENLAERFCREQIFGIGSTVKRFIHNFNEAHLPWYEAGDKSAGNGALMRIAPILIPHLKHPTNTLWTDTAIASAVTHKDPGSIAACVSFTNILWELLHMDSQPDPSWWLDTYCAIAKQIEGDTFYKSRQPEIDYEGPIWKFTQEVVQQAFEKHLGIVEACNGWYSGAYLMETIPSALYILMCYGDDPEEAIIRAVNDTWDNDTIAAIVGATVGALHGKSALPKRWLDKLLGRTSANDDGRIFELISQAKTRFWI
jgi:ADP-ribosyl-[dinitrogen reductase] hydrolase